MQLSGFEIKWSKADGSKGTDCICLKCLPEQGGGYEGDAWKPIHLEDSDAACSYCGAPMTFDHEDWDTFESEGDRAERIAKLDAWWKRATRRFLDTGLV